MTIYEALQEQNKKFKFSKSGVLYLNTFEPRENSEKAKLKDKPFALYKTEESKRIDKKAKAEINKARVHGNAANATYEMQEGILHYVANPVKAKKKEEDIVEEATEEEAV